VTPIRNSLETTGLIAATQEEEEPVIYDDISQLKENVSKKNDKENIQNHVTPIRNSLETTSLIAATQQEEEPVIYDDLSKYLKEGQPEVKEDNLDVKKEEEIVPSNAKTEYSEFGEQKTEYVDFQVNQDYYQNLSREEAEKKLYISSKESTYLVRYSSNTKSFVISKYSAKENGFYHIIIQENNGLWSLKDCSDKKQYDSIQTLLKNTPEVAKYMQIKN